MFTFTLKIVELAKDTPDVVTIFFKQPALKKIKYISGQYLTLVVRVNGRKYIRPYSFSSSPDIDAHLAITIKRVPGGIVSNYLYDYAQVGELQEVMPPMGGFIYQPDINNASHVMLWGAGSGITPLMSILKTVLKKTSDIKVSLFYCNRDADHTIFKNELAELKKAYLARFNLYNFYTRVTEDAYLRDFVAGRIDELKIMNIFSYESELEKTIHYICGPDGLKQTVKNALAVLKILPANIFTEEFEVAIDPQKFDDVETREVTVINAGIKYHIKVAKGTSILNAALDHGIDMSYSCQTGTCLLCKAKIITGKLKLIGIDRLPEGLEPDDCLLCCSYPYSEDIEILTLN